MGTFEALGKNNNLKLQNVAAQVLTRTKTTEKITPVQKSHTVSQVSLRIDLNGLGPENINELLME